MACCSAMPTSKNRRGNSSWNGVSPVGPGMAAVMATMSSLLRATARSSSPEHAGPVGFFHLEWQTGFGVDLPSGVHELRHVVFGRRVAAAFFRHHVERAGAVVVAGVCHGGIEGFLVVSVDWAHIFEPQVGEHFGGDDAGFHAFFKGVERFECALPHPAEGISGWLCLAP